MLLLLLSACATDGRNERDARPAVIDVARSAQPALETLRNYLGLPAGEQAARRESLQVAAASGDRMAEVAYALALSVDRDSRLRLEHAYERLAALLATPDPLPAALDTLVRLQLGQVIDRLERMRRAEQLAAARAASAATTGACRAELARCDSKLEELREKLRALARIEQTVENGGQDNKPRDRNNEDDDADR